MPFSVAAGPWEACRPRSLHALVPFPGGRTAATDSSLEQPGLGLWSHPSLIFSAVCDASFSFSGTEAYLVQESFRTGSSRTNEKEALDASLTRGVGFALILVPSMACWVTLVSHLGLIKFAISRRQVKRVG